MNTIKTAVDACYNSYDDAQSIQVDDMYYHVCDIDGTTYVAIRGTDNKMNVRRNLRFWPAPSPKGHIAHKGFVGASNVLVQEAKRIKEESKNFIITGHSLGGATAIILAEALECQVISFGSPRVYFKWGSSPTLNHLRILCDDDPVPMIPRLLYKHVESQSLVLHDNDGGIDTKDHDIDVYRSRVYAYFNGVYNG